MIDTINIVNRQIAKQYNLEENIVKTINQFFWKQGIREAVQSGAHTNIRITKIGTLVGSRRKVNEQIKRTIVMIRKIQDPNKVFKVKTKEQRLDEAYTYLRMLLSRRNDIANIYINTRANHELLKNSMAEQVTNNAGLDSQDLFG